MTTIFDSMFLKPHDGHSVYGQKRPDPCDCPPERLPRASKASLEKVLCCAKKSSRVEVAELADSLLGMYGADPAELTLAVERLRIFVDLIEVLNPNTKNVMEIRKRLHVDDLERLG